MRPCQLRQIRGGWNERFEVRRQRISWPRTNDVGKFLRRICAIDGRHLQELERMGQSARALQPAIHWAQLSKSQILDPVSNFTLFSASNDRHTSQQTCAKNSPYAVSSSASLSRWCSPRRMCTSGSKQG